MKVIDLSPGDAGMAREHLITIKRATTEGMMRSSVDSLGAHNHGDLHKRTMIGWLK